MLQKYNRWKIKLTQDDSEKTKIDITSCIMLQKYNLLMQFRPTNSRKRFQKILQRQLQGKMWMGSWVITQFKSKTLTITARAEKREREITSTADTCKNCAKRGKGFKIGTNEAYNIKIKIRLGAFRKFSAFVLTPIWLPQTKAFH